MAYFMGIDIGSTTTKGVVTCDGEVVARHLILSGTNYRSAADELTEELLALAGTTRRELVGTVATGQGAANAVFSDRQVTDILCCARGIHRVFPTVRTVIDVQGQSSQVLRLGEQGQVTDFVVSEKCASGCGRFLDIIANVLQVRLEEVGPLSMTSQNPVTFTTACAVFGESEAVSRVAEGVSKEDILAGVHQALAEKLASLVRRVGLEEDCAITGGGGLNVGLVERLEVRLGVRLLVPPEPQFITALGAAILAEEPNPVGEPSRAG
ncbi:MAG: acyl-CoA dehydratase activase [Dehalococcoidales bacterium]